MTQCISLEFWNEYWEVQKAITALEQTRATLTEKINEFSKQLNSYLISTDEFDEKFSSIVGGKFADLTASDLSTEKVRDWVLKAQNKKEESEKSSIIWRP